MNFNLTDFKKFMKSILEEKEDEVKAFIDNGIDVNYEDEIGNNPLILAAKTDNVNLLKLLFLAGAKLENSNLLFETPLMEAVDLNKPNAMRYLLSVGANIDVKDYRGLDLLARALNNPRLEPIQILIESGIAITNENREKLLSNKNLKDFFISFEEKKYFEKNLLNSSHFKRNKI